MLRVVMVSDTPRRNVGGVERFAYSLSHFLQQRGFVVEAVNHDSLKDWTPRWIDRLGLQMPRRSRQLGVEALKKTAGSGDGSSVIIQNGMAGWNLRGQTTAPRIVVHHGTWRGSIDYALPPGTRWQTRLARYVLTGRMLGGFEQYAANGAYSVAVSGAVADELRKFYKGIDPVVIPNGIDTSHFLRQDRSNCRERFGFAHTDFVACYTGRIEYGKGSDILLALAWQARSDKPGIKFLVATDRVPQGWPDNVVFATDVGYEGMPAVYSAADVFVFPTRYEGCSYSLLEAMACGLPAISGKVGYASDIHRDVPEWRPFIMAQADAGHYWRMLTALSEHESQLDKLGTIGCEYVRAHNSVSTMVDAYIKLMERIVAGAGK